MKNGIDYEQVEKAVRSSGKTMVDFYTFVGFSRQSNTNFKKQGYIPIKYADRVSAFLNLPLVNVMKSDIIRALREKGSQLSSHQKDDYINVPMIPAGAGAEALGDVELIDNVHIEKRLLSRDLLSSIDENTMIIKVIGNSMETKINENDILFIDMANGRNIVMADGVYLVRYGNTIQIKQVQFLGNGDINLISFNKDYPDYKPSSDGIDWEILGKPFMRWGVDMYSKLELI